ncbi:hypothetical protein B0H16DRAFT_1699232 [Mycena metata]|uniref:Uncharacterized protein n=1 Tax=Mycena metata TaxID=1033252 RepID=A0AAD7HKJ1_9AGAR|nr:hypothetical protein B0H16DRAFT_1699232 [Mycena metata]
MVRALADKVDVDGDKAEVVGVRETTGSPFVEGAGRVRVHGARAHKAEMDVREMLDGDAEPVRARDGTAESVRVREVDAEKSTSVDGDEAEVNETLEVESVENVGLRGASKDEETPPISNSTKSILHPDANCVGPAKFKTVMPPVKLSNAHALFLLGVWGFVSYVPFLVISALWSRSSQRLWLDGGETQNSAQMPDTGQLNRLLIPRLFTPVYSLTPLHRVPTPPLPLNLQAFRPRTVELLAPKPQISAKSSFRLRTKPNIHPTALDLAAELTAAAARLETKDTGVCTRPIQPLYAIKAGAVGVYGRSFATFCGILRPRCSELARPRHHLDKVHRSKNSPGNRHRVPRRANFVWGGFEGHTELRNHSPIFSLRSGPCRTVFCAVEPRLIPQARTDCTKLDHAGRTPAFIPRQWTLPPLPKNQCGQQIPAHMKKLASKFFAIPQELENDLLPPPSLSIAKMLEFPLPLQSTTGTATQPAQFFSEDVPDIDDSDLLLSWEEH